MMTTNSTGDNLYCCNCEHEPWQCHNSVVYVAKGRIIETNCIVENTPPPHFALDVVHKMGEGVLTGDYGKQQLVAEMGGGCIFEGGRIILEITVVLSDCTHEDTNMQSPVCMHSLMSCIS